MPKKHVRLTRLELEIMRYVWDLGEAAVREIHEAIPASKRPAYTTIQTILTRLEEKGAVRRTRKIGNAHLYQAVTTRQSTGARLMDELLDLFGGDSEPLVAHLIDSGKLTLEDVKHAEEVLKKRRK
ncbi:MAG TPA: BlaI/MecI/CopY family transcriptional regulator [Thermoanaerobaculia bacterium]|nr:BlaI/MecI/CopY family transcriptional regulator [Thermoanaerobaculia bacterium]